MANYTSSLGLELITPGSQAGLWGNTTNNSLNLLDQAITGVTPYSGFTGVTGATWVPTDYNGAQDEARAAVFNFTGTATGPNTVEIPNKQKTYFVRNGTGQDIVFKTAIGTTPCTVGAGYNLPIFCDGNNNVFLAILAPGAGTLTVTGGGTGATNFAAGGFIKSSGGTNALTASPTVNASSEISGTLPVVNGGTGKSSVTAGVLLQGNGTATLTEFVGGVNGYIPTWNAATNAWVAQAPAIAGVSTITAGGGILVNGGSGPASGPVTISNSGVTSATAGSGILLSGSTGGITITNNGVLSVGAGSGINVSGTGGALTVSNSGVLTVNGSSGNVSVTPASIGALSTTGTAANSNQLGGVAASSYLTSTSGTAYDSARLGGTLASSYLTTSGTAYDSARLGGTAASAYARYAAAGTWSAAQTINNIGTGVQGWIVSGSGLVSGLSNSSVQIGYNGQGVGSSSLGSMSVFVSGGGAWNLSGGNVEWTGSGDAFKNGGGSWAVRSDVRLKTNVAPLTGCLDKITRLNPVSYAWKYQTTELTIGFIAQEVEAVMPTAVNTVPPTDEQAPFIDDDKVKTIGWKNDMMAYLVGAIKELKAEIDALKAAR